MQTPACGSRLGGWLAAPGRAGSAAQPNAAPSRVGAASGCCTTYSSLASKWVLCDCDL